MRLAVELKNNETCEGSEMLKTRLKPKSCICGDTFYPGNSLQKVCSPQCALELVERKKEQQVRKEQRAAKRRLRENDRAWQMKKAQEAFNKFIRLRDKDQPCISCGRHHQGQYHAGHYRTVGAHPELRFEELNCHSQCAPCNNHKSGDIVNYRKNLLVKIGAEKLEWLEGPHEPKHYSLDEIKAIRAKYQAKAKELEP